MELILAERATELGLEERPWVTLYNPYYGPRRSFTLFISPFPWEEFPPASPWENHSVLAWNNKAEELAKQSGYNSVHSYIQQQIRISVDRHLI